MIHIGLVAEGKIPADNRVALTPAQCKWLRQNHPEIKITVQHSFNRCFSDNEYMDAGITVAENLGDCGIILGIKEVPVDMLIDNKTYLFFSHTKKLQPYNQHLFQTIIKKNITLIDYECLEHEDGTRIIGFGFFAGVVGAHNGMMAYGNRTGSFKLERVNGGKNFQHLIHTYFGLKLPPVKIAVTGSGRVAHGVLEIMNLMGIHEVEPEDYCEKEFVYPVYVHLKGADLYKHKIDGTYSRKDFHKNPENYVSIFSNFMSNTDILMNGVYWEQIIPRLFNLNDLSNSNFRIKTIADITDDMGGSIPCNIGDSTIADPVYGVDKITYEKTAPYQTNAVDVMAVGNLPNELPRDASRYFGEQLIKHVFTDLFSSDESRLINTATIIKKGKLNDGFEYMKEYASRK